MLSRRLISSKPSRVFLRSFAELLASSNASAHVVGYFTAFVHVLAPVRVAISIFTTLIKSTNLSTTYSIRGASAFSAGAKTAAMLFFK